MDADEIAKEISERVGEIVNVTVKVTNKHQELDVLKIMIDAHKTQAESYHKMLLDALKISDRDCLSLEDLEKFQKAMLESIDETYEKMKKQIEEKGI